MRILLLHPEDSPRRGPWATERWDQIIDLGKSSESTARAWGETTRCPVRRLQSFRRSIEDPRTGGQILRGGFGHLLDEHGLDWWELISIFIHSELETAMALQRLAAQTDLQGELYATRPDWPVRGLSFLLGRDIQAFGHEAGFAGRARRFARSYRKLTLRQMVEIFWDKYDGGYRWRSRITSSGRHSSQPVVLLPSAYSNVSRTAVGYARILPEQPFLLVTTRASGLQCDTPSNVKIARLASFARSWRPHDTDVLLREWESLRAQLERVPEMALLSRAGLLEPFPHLLKDGLGTRDAWLSVLEQEPVTAVMCGDDSNWYTRIPVVLAKKRNLPTMDFHHGALDGRFLLKDLSSDAYLAKSGMERDYLTRVCGLSREKVVVGGPTVAATSSELRREREGSVIVFFSEPYESLGGRPEEVYWEILPRLSRLARDHGRALVLKLHPFENPAERGRLAEAVIGNDASRNLRIVSGPLQEQLLATAWFGVTVESSTVLDCARSGVPCFQCGWLVSTPWGYVDQFARFGLGRLLHSADDVLNIPRMLAEDRQESVRDGALDSPITADALAQLLQGRSIAVSSSEPS